MRIVSAKIDDETHAAFYEYCQGQGASINEVIGSLIRQAVSGKLKPAPTGLAARLPFCPRCGYILFPNFSEGTLNCLRCGFFALAPGPKKWKQGQFEIE